MDLVYLGARLLWSISQCIIDLGLVLVYNGLYWCPSTMVYFAMHSRCCSTHHRWLTLPLLVHTMTLLAKAAHFPHNFDKDKLSDGLLSGLLCLYCLITKQHCERINFLPDYSLRNYTPGAGGWKLKPMSAGNPVGMQTRLCKVSFQARLEKIPKHFTEKYKQFCREIQKNN